MGMLGNTLLLSYFLDREEGSAAVVQVVGIVSNAIMLLQVGQREEQEIVCSNADEQTISPPELGVISAYLHFKN